MVDRNHPRTPHSARVDAAAVFNVKTISQSRCRGKKASTLLEAAQHNLREIHPERGAVNGIDPRLSGNNVVLCGPSSAAAIMGTKDRLLSQLVGLRLKRDHVQAIEFMFSVPVNFSHHRDYFQRCLSWAEQAVGLPILSAVIHLDQNCPHMHVLLLPVKGGRHVGGSPINRPSLHRLRNSFFEVVAGPAGFQRGNPKLHGAIKRLAIEAVITEAFSRGLPEQAGEFWPTLEGAITADPLPLVMQLGIDLKALRSAAPGR
jgi:hypothetical protein